jgi:hypothetical protein
MAGNFLKIWIFSPEEELCPMESVTDQEASHPRACWDSYGSLSHCTWTKITTTDELLVRWHSNCGERLCNYAGWLCCDFQQNRKQVLLASKQKIEGSLLDYGWVNRIKVKWKFVKMCLQRPVDVYSTSLRNAWRHKATEVVCSTIAYLIL